ncbi:30S ribosomal protein S20 [Phormidium sp. CLA17]|uniref:30S ribosomal protein S20 n=1 Tax=Leptolyngbya sp. Cla-17 TaxID=2803751 RepID=UPI001491E1B9|nr:30S ribosomal protein S20 [Leptolyngbya sp. Cla-17]MBM0743006.1 30S ribosomal protein S20 [Leptolyngbya sp. Cla-17]
MANIKSAIKRVGITERNRLRNKSYKTAVKTFVKKCFTAVSSHAASPTPESEQTVQSSLASAYSQIDKAVKRGALHANTAARKKSRLMRAVKSLEAAQPEVS